MVNPAKTGKKNSRDKKISKKNCLKRKCICQNEVQGASIYVYIYMLAPCTSDKNLKISELFFFVF